MLSLSLLGSACAQSPVIDAYPPPSASAAREPSSIHSCIDLFAESNFAQPLSAGIIDRINDFVIRDREIAISDTHASSVRLHTNFAGVPIKTAKAVLLIHGLFNSPDSMRAQSDAAFAQGYNVVNLRLAGHFEKSRRALDKTIMDHWIAQTNEAADLALAIGETVFGIGHSAGGLLLAELAAARPADVTQLFLISPAFKMTSFQYKYIYWLTRFHISGWLPEMFHRPAPDERYVSSWAGWQFVKLTKRARTMNASAGAEPFDFLIKGLAHTRITVIDTANDQTIDTGETDQFLSRLRAEQQSISPGENLITHKTIAEHYALIHSAMSSATQNEGYRQVTQPALLRDLRAR